MKMMRMGVILLLSCMCWPVGAQLKTYQGSYDYGDMFSGEAKYSYIEGEEGRIFQGNFTYLLKMTLPNGVKIEHAVNGDYDNNLRVGKWTDMVKGNHDLVGIEVITRNYNQGKLNGEYSQIKSTTNPKNIVELVKTNFRDNMYADSIAILYCYPGINGYEPPVVTIGYFDEDGCATGIWATEDSDKGLLYKKTYKNGLLVKETITEPSTGNVRIGVDNTDKVEAFMANYDAKSGYSVIDGVYYKLGEIKKELPFNIIPVITNSSRSGKNHPNRLRGDAYEFISPFREIEEDEQKTREEKEKERQRIEAEKKRIMEENDRLIAEFRKTPYGSLITRLERESPERVKERNILTPKRKELLVAGKIPSISLPEGVAEQFEGATLLLLPQDIALDLDKNEWVATKALIVLDLTKNQDSQSIETAFEKRELTWTKDEKGKVVIPKQVVMQKKEVELLPLSSIKKKPSKKLYYYEWRRDDVSGLIDPVALSEEEITMPLEKRLNLKDPDLVNSNINSNSKTIKLWTENN